MLSLVASATAVVGSGDSWSKGAGRQCPCNSGWWVQSTGDGFWALSIMASGASKLLLQ